MIIRSFYRAISTESTEIGFYTDWENLNVYLDTENGAQVCRMHLDRGMTMKEKDVIIRLKAGQEEGFASNNYFLSENILFLEKKNRRKGEDGLRYTPFTVVWPTEASFFIPIRCFCPSCLKQLLVSHLLIIFFSSHMIRLQFFGNFSLIDRVCIGEDNCSKDVTRLKKILENENDKKKRRIRLEVRV